MVTSKVARGAACQACRKGHLSCDRGTPACARCRESGRPCTRSFNVRFSKRRAWAPPALSSSSSPPRLRGPSHTSPNPENISERSEQPCRLETPSQFHSDPESPDCVVEASAKNGYASPNSSDTTDLCGSTQSQSQQIVHLISPPLTLAPEDASLLQYFGDCVGRPWFDLTASDFTIEALRIAPSCPVLCYSILAVASFYYCCQTGQDDGRAELFHQKAISLLSTLMRNPSHLADGVGLASVVILRLYEESKARQDGQDAESHLLAGHVFAATIASGVQQPTTKLAQAAFWVHQRQDVCSSIARLKPTRTCLDNSPIWEPGHPSDIYTWTKRAQKLAGEIANFCFRDQEVRRSAQRFGELQNQLSQWSEETWPEFQPLLFLNRDVKTGRILPDIRFSLNACLMGYIHFRLSQLLLAMYNPSSMALGPEAFDQHKQMESEVQDHVRVLCGIARHNSCPVGKVFACIAITLGYRWVHDPVERLELFNILRLCKQEHAWCNFALEDNLRHLWGIGPST